MDISFNHLQISIGILVFVAYTMIDWLYVRYTYSVVKKEPVMAASIGVMMHFLIAFGVISYVDNVLYVIPLGAGSWLGTYLAVRQEQKNLIHQQHNLCLSKK